MVACAGASRNGKELPKADGAGWKKNTGPPTMLRDLGWLDLDEKKFSKVGDFSECKDTR